MLLGDTHTVYGSLHNWAPGPDWGELQTLAMGDDASQEWEDYQVVWQPGYISWAVDGVAYAQYSDWQAASNGQSWPFDDGAGFYLIADLAVTGQNDSGRPADLLDGLPRHDADPVRQGLAVTAPPAAADRGPARRRYTRPGGAS